MATSAKKQCKLHYCDEYREEISECLQKEIGWEDVDDFWKFYNLYEASKSDKTDCNRSLLIPIIAQKLDIRLVVDCYARKGHSEKISYSDSKNFQSALALYYDFQQRSKFARLKKLRKTQRELPISKYKEVLLEKLSRNRVILIAGDTGCGKSTQVPQYVLEAGYNKIVCTQPRRIACVALAKRVAFETLTEFNATIAYQIRFETTKREETRVVFMTEGLLLRQAGEEETLNSYDVIILDEVHERHLHGDFLIGLMKCLLHKRNDFKLILMSATINLDLFKEYFAGENVEVVEVPGRLYPVEVRYCPIVKDPFERKKSGFNCTPYLQIIQMIDETYESNDKGDVLIFLNGFFEITTLADAISEYAECNRRWIVLQLHSSLSLEEQDKVFSYPPDGMRKCIISTNIAETSVTIDGIRFVIDSGKVNRMMYNSSGAFSKLLECNISQDSAKQRAGRAGRTGPGICFRMYSEEDFKCFEPFTPAEIHLVPLDTLILNMISLGLTDIEKFPFLEKPSAKTIRESIEKLKYYGALQPERELLALTPLGEAFSNLPVDLIISKMLIVSTLFRNVNSVLALAALLSVQSPLTQKAYRDMEASDLRKPLESNHGDPFCLFNYYKEWLRIKKERVENTREWAKKRCLEEQRFYEASKLTDQFRDILIAAEFLKKEEDKRSNAERVIRKGELKQLRGLKYNLVNEKRLDKRKQLNNSDDDDDEVGETSRGIDIRDVEFRIANDSKRLQRLLDEATNDSNKDIVLLKLILTSGLYPQIAIEDELNNSKTVTDRLYHTKTKSYVFLRPLSYFATNTDCLALHNDDIEVPPPGYFSKHPISKKHQLLIYQSILETKKVYLVNVMRMPLLQTLLLFAKTIATNATLTKMVFDDFILVDLPYFGQGKIVLLKAINLRSKWKRNIDGKLADKTVFSTYSFKQDLMNFMYNEVSYNVKRLLPADLKVIYKRNSLETFDETEKNPFDSNYKLKINEEYGGVNITENIVYDCLLQEDWANEIEKQLSVTPYLCPHCEQIKSGVDTFFKILQHEMVCPKKSKQQQTAPYFKPAEPSRFCEYCKQNLSALTQFELLRHNRTCH